MNGKAGILVKGGQYPERAAAVKDVLFDKTGTLTPGEPGVDEIISVEGVDKDAVLSYEVRASGIARTLWPGPY